MDDEKADKFMQKEMKKTYSVKTRKIEYKSLIQGKSQGGQIYDLD